MRNSAIEFFLSIPDDLMVEIALNDWESLENLCVALTVDLQLLKEEINHPNDEGFSNRGNVH